jgi:hypothetical protein
MHAQHLVEFVQKRDKRVIEHNVRVTREKEEKERRQREEQLKQDQERQKRLREVPFPFYVCVSVCGGGGVRLRVRVRVHAPSRLRYVRLRRSACLSVSFALVLWSFDAVQWQAKRWEELQKEINLEELHIAESEGTFTYTCKDRKIAAEEKVCVMEAR